jgi:hypothetical protein
LASIATTMHWDPNRSEDSMMSPGSAIAAVLSETLSAPARSIASMSSAPRRPPPTVSGMKQRSAVAATTPCRILRPSEEAVMSRKTSSSAPWAS